MKGTTEIKTERLLLRRHLPKDAGVLYELAGQDEEMYRYSGWNPYATLTMAEETVKSFIGSYVKDDFFGWGIEYEGRLAGTIGAYDYDPETQSIEAGFSIFSPYQGHGFASEALEAVLAYLLSQEEIICVTAWCAAENKASFRTMEKAGMKLFQSLKNDLHVNDQTCDRLILTCREEDLK